MPRGGDRRSKPTALKVVQGNPGKRKLNAAEPKPTAGSLKAPPGLDYYGKWLWASYAPILQRLGLYTEADTLALSTLCMAYSRWRKALKDLEGLMPGDPGYRDIAITVEKAEQSLRMLANEFGMTPASRSRLSVKQEEPVDPFEQWAKKA